MSLEKVKQAVLSDAQSRAKAMTDEAKAEAQRMLKNAKDTAGAQRKQVEEELVQAEQMVVDKAVSAAELARQKRLLALKKSLIDDVFTQVEEQISKRKDAERKKDIATLLKRAEKELDVARIVVAKQDKKLATGDAKTQDMLGGLIAESKDGRVRVDFRYEGMLDTMRDELGAELAELLFK